MWEDEKNRLGGRWLINLSKNARSSDLDKMWLEIVGILFFKSSLVCYVRESPLGL